MKHIVNVFVARDQAEGVAQYWRDQGNSARIFPRTVRAAGLATQVFAVVVAPKAPKAK